MCTNTDQFVNKRDDLCLLICGNELDVILLTKTIPKAQKLSMDLALLHIPGYVLYRGLQLLWYTLGSGLFCRLVSILWHREKCFTVY